MNMYLNSIKAKLVAENIWRQFTNPDAFADLDQLADDALCIDTLDEHSCIASILMLQQIVEEILKNVLNMSNILVQGKILPLKMECSLPYKKMFGAVVSDLKKHIEFEKKDEFIKLSQSINSIRIEVAHGLLNKYDINSLKASAIDIRKNFEEFLDVYSYVFCWFSEEHEKLLIELGIEV